MSISVLSWNIQEFGKKKKTKTPAQVRARATRVAHHIRNQDPDVFGLIEVESMDILNFMQEEFPNYDFSITDGPRNNKEILVGRRQGRFDQIVFSQKRQFDLYNPYLRPGALLSARLGTKWFNFLFLHTDSGTEARDYGNRYEMFDKVWRLRKALDKKDDDKRENLVVLGDLITMGLHYPRKIKSHLLVNGPAEVIALGDFASANDMQLLEKSHLLTYRKFGRSLTSDLDHVLASDSMTFQTLGAREDGTDFKVRVKGWNDKPKAQREKILRENNDGA